MCIWSAGRNRIKKPADEDIEKFHRYFRNTLTFGDKKTIRASPAARHSKIGKTHPTTANRVLALMSSVYGRAIEWGLSKGTNPAQGIRKFPEKSRDRFLQSDELPVFFEALALEPNEQLQDYFMLLLLTGCRRSNLMAMRVG